MHGNLLINLSLSDLVTLNIVAGRGWSLGDHALHHLLKLSIRYFSISINIDLLDHVTPHLVINLLALVKQSLDLR
jgi:hypothetical protein